MTPRSHPHRLALAAGLLLLLGSPASASAADLFVRTSIPGWTNIPPHAVFSAWGDYDGDGLLDVCVGRVKNNSSFSGASTNLLYHHNADHSFTRKFAGDVGPLVGDLLFGEAHWIDVNGDGHLDLWNMAFELGPKPSPVVGPLYLNRGDGTFAAVTAGALTTPRLPSGFASWTDYDNDGRLDVFIPTGWNAWSTRTNTLLHGRADGTFDLVTSERIVTDVAVDSNDSIWGDLDGDGDADLLVANNSSRGFHYRNDGGGLFTRMTNSPLDTATYPCSHHALGDFDRDGDLDVIAYGQGAAYIFFNDGAGVFTLSQTFTRGGAETPYPGDYDNDGDVDFLLSEISFDPKPLTLFRNVGTGKFAIVNEAFTGTASSWSLGSWTDYDNDGFLDLFVGQGSSGTHPVWLYRNQGNGNHWLKFNLVGTHSHRSAIGAKIRVRATLGGASVWQLREIVGNRTAEDGRRAHFGLGDATQVDEVVIEWPSGNVQTLTNLAADQILTVTEPVLIRPEHPVVTIHGRVVVTNLVAATARQWYFEGALLEGQSSRLLTLTNVQPAQAGRYTVVAQTDTGPLTNHVYVRVETRFTKILEGEVVTESRQDSHASWFDYDNDGAIDLYVPNGATPNSLFHNLRDGTFQRAPNTTRLALQDAAAFVAPGDFNRDGNLDLFVASPGTHDELFLGDGAGGFTPLQAQPFQLEHPATWNVGLADIDGDGDLDVMTVGNQGNALYRNEGGTRFLSAGPAEVGSLLDSPAANRQSWSCVWSDYDADGDPDVVIMYSGGAPILHQNLGDGRFRLGQAGSLTTLPADWVCAFGDYDNDGDLDAFTGRWQEGQARLHQNAGDGTFAHVAPTGDLGSTSMFGHGSWVDYDNDGFLDLLFLGYEQLGSMYRNRGDGTFQAVDLGNLASDGTNRSMAAWADYDNNGFQDLLVVCGDGVAARNQLYRNNGNGNHWLKFRLAGTTSNRDGIGARVRVKATIQGRSLWQLREIQSAGGDASGTPLLAHFGLGDATHAEIVRVEWPSGIVQELRQVPVDRFSTLEEPAPIRLSCVRQGERLRIECQAGPATICELRTSSDLGLWTVLTNLTTDAEGRAAMEVTPVTPGASFYRAVRK